MNYDNRFTDARDVVLAELCTRMNALEAEVKVLKGKKSLYERLIAWVKKRYNGK